MKQEGQEGTEYWNVWQCDLCKWKRAVPKWQYVRKCHSCGSSYMHVRVVKMLSGILVVYEEREE